MIKFYEIMASNLRNVPLALNDAQQWLRQATQVQILQWIEGKIEIKIEEQQKIKDYLFNYKPEEQPFKKPEFWAAFCAISPVYFSANVATAIGN